MCAGCERRARALPGSPDSRRLGRECSAQPRDTLALPRRVGPRREMTVERTAVYGDHSTLKFCISDTGIGMDKEFIPKIFEIGRAHV